MKLRIFCIIACVVMVVALTPSAALAAGSPPPAGPLQPGKVVTYQQTIPINIVFIGFSQAQVNKQTLLKGLAPSYTPLVRDPQFYGLSGRNMGLNYSLKYNVVFTSTAFTSQFFSYLKKIGTSGDLTAYQQAYNDEVKNVLDVTGPVLYIDGPSVEKWLSTNVSGISKNSYTVIFVNWFGRPDFKFHVYTKTDEPDPDTGYNFGALRASRKMIAWGGGQSRLWFYDFSAGPEAFSGNWNVDDADLDRDTVPDYRIPPIWEYTAKGYRKPNALTGDMGLLTRYVATDLLFTSSPLYDPMVTAPGLLGQKVVNINVLEDDPASHGADWLSQSFVNKELANFEPYYRWFVHPIDTNPIDANAQRAFRIWADVLKEDDCWNTFGYTFAELFCYFDANRAAYVPKFGPTDFVVPILGFNTTDTNMGDESGLLGYTDDNWVDGTQSYVFAFDSDYYRSLGYGFSTTVTHETGHYLGLSHPHDGYDPTAGLDFGAAGDFYFTWSGDESNTIMSYNDLSDEFSRFDKDNLYRWETAGYLNWSNDLLGKILAAPNASKVYLSISNAQKAAGLALNSFQQWNYLDAVTNARMAYTSLSAAAALLGIPTPSQAVQAQPSKLAPRQTDPIRFPND